GVHAMRIDLVPGRGFDDLDLDGTPELRPVEAPADAVAVLQYTSGTTGGLKAAAMTHANLVANALQNNIWFSWTRDDVILGALPLQHTWGMCCVMNASLAAGARVVLLPHFDPEAVLAAIERERVTVAYGSATMFHRLLDAAGADAPRRLASLRYVKAGAMLVGSDLYARWTAAVPLVPMINGYGLTEASPEVSNNPPHARRGGTVGVPLPGTEIRLGVVESPDVESAPGAEGEVQIRGPQVMSGYWRNEEATRAAFTSDGWLRTGDLATFDEAGYLVIRDRLKDLIKYRGWSVVPGEVERVLREHAAVAEACVVGVPDPRDGEMPVAYVVLRPGSGAPDADAWRAHLADRLATYKHPRRFVVVAEIPKNHVGKPLRRELRARPLL
ncbi:MAG: AMP-binding protein, partial [Planctomycetes bacterium]|nr:AMP-binding protein [Planctomycetota bacterium]